jgi:hypothetical protein
MVKKYKSVSRELFAKAKSLGLSTSFDQILPDLRDSDRLRNSSPYDVDDRLFAYIPDSQNE